MKLTLKIALATTAMVSGLVTLEGSGWSDLSLSVSKAEAATRLYVSPINPYSTATDLPWYAVRAYYFGGPWSGPGYSWDGWTGYAARNGIACVPGTIVKGGDGILYRCQ